MVPESCKGELVAKSPRTALEQLRELLRRLFVENSFFNYAPRSCLTAIFEGTYDMMNQKYLGVLNVF